MFCCVFCVYGICLIVVVLVYMSTVDFVVALLGLLLCCLLSCVEALFLFVCGVSSWIFGCLDGVFKFGGYCCLGWCFDIWLLLTVCLLFDFLCV